MDFGALIVATILGLWLLISIPYQMADKYWRRLKSANTFGILPGWTFFAPNPGTSDYRLVFRDLTPRGMTEWTEVEWCRSRKGLDALWHPGRQRTKLVVDCVNALIITVKELRRHDVDVEANPQGWLLSVPYMALLNIVNTMPRISPNARARQFAIIEQNPLEDSYAGSKLILCSPPHDF
ncbi:MAG: hypothetical protein QOH92_566 [Chloroflexota bacterium]|jgi:hypothetical protein|nr:hypothetical protein [Chloroflexota bacterium]